MLDTEIVSADSRQIFRDMKIGTASPSDKQLSKVRHHLVGTLNIDEYYSAAKFEEDALRILSDIWNKSDYAVMCGGAMMYIDAITNGIDTLPTISTEVRESVAHLYQQGGIIALIEELSEIDPDFLKICDKTNPRRLMHAIEIFREANIPYSKLRTGNKVIRPFKILKIAINWTRPELFEKINLRVEKMIEAGLEEEAAKLYPFRHLNSLNTVGYKEMFAMMEGRLSRDTAISRIAKNTRVYAKKQLLWLSKDSSVIYLDPSKELLPQAMNVIFPENITTKTSFAHL